MKAESLKNAALTQTLSRRERGPDYILTLSRRERGPAYILTLSRRERGPAYILTLSRRERGPDYIQTFSRRERGPADTAGSNTIPRTLFMAAIGRKQRLATIDAVRVGLPRAAILLAVLAIGLAGCASVPPAPPAAATTFNAPAYVPTAAASGYPSPGPAYTPVAATGSPSAAPGYPAAAPTAAQPVSYTPGATPPSAVVSAAGAPATPVAPSRPQRRSRRCARGDGGRQAEGRRRFGGGGLRLGQPLPGRDVEELHEVDRPRVRTRRLPGR